MRYFIHFVFLAVVGGCGPVSCLASGMETKLVMRCSSFEDRKEMLDKFSSDSMLMYLTDGWRMQPDNTTINYDRPTNEYCVSRTFSRPKSLF